MSLFFQEKRWRRAIPDSLICSRNVNMPKMCAKVHKEILGSDRFRKNHVFPSLGLLIENARFGVLSWQPMTDNREVVDKGRVH